MAKLITVGQEITAQAHRARFLYDKIFQLLVPDHDAFYKRAKELEKILTSLENDLESINLEGLIQRFNARGRRISREESRRHTRREIKKNSTQRRTAEEARIDRCSDLIDTLANAMTKLLESRFLSKTQLESFSKFYLDLSNPDNYLPEFREIFKEVPLGEEK